MKKNILFFVTVMLSLFCLPGQVSTSGEVVGVVGTDSSANYQERSIQDTYDYMVTKKRNQVITPHGKELRDDQGFFVYTPKESGMFCYRVFDSNTVSVDGLAAFHRSGQTFITWDEREGATQYTILRGSCPEEESVQVVETEVTPTPIVVAESKFGKVYTMFMDQDNWNAHVFRGQTYSFTVAVPEWYDGRDMPVTVHMEGYGSRYYLPEAAPYNLNNIYVRIDDPVFGPSFGEAPDYSANKNLGYGWYFGHPCEGTNPATAGVCNYLEHAILRAVKHVKQEYHVDENRVYALGHSMGATGALSLGLRYPNVFASIYASEPMTNFKTSGSAGGTNWASDVTDSWGSSAQNYPFHPVGETKAAMQELDGVGVWDVQNQIAFVCDYRHRDTALITLAHGTADQVIDTDTQGYPFYRAASDCALGFQAVVTNADHSWQGYQGQGMNSHKEKYDGVYDSVNFTYKKGSFPAFSRASGSSSTSGDGEKQFNQNIQWSTDDNALNNFDGPIVDSAESWEVGLRSFGGDQTVDITPRRLQVFNPQPGHMIGWKNKDASGTVVASGNIVVDKYGLATVPQFRITTGGNRLVLLASRLQETIDPPEGDKEERVSTPEESGVREATQAAITVPKDTTVRRACALATEKAYKHPHSPAVYYVSKDCKKRAFLNRDVFFTYFRSWNVVTADTRILSVPDHELGFMPWGPTYVPKNGELMKIVDDPRVFVRADGKLYWITSEDAFVGRGYQWGWIVDVDPGVFAQYDSAGEYTLSGPRLNGSLVKYAGNPAVYKIEDGKKRHILSEQDLLDLNYRLDRIITLQSGETFEDGDALGTPGRRSPVTTPTPVVPSPVTPPENTPVPDVTIPEEPEIPVNGSVVMNVSLRNTISAQRHNAPVTWAIPLGTEQDITDPASVRLSQNGTLVPAQFTPTARWGGTPNDGNKKIAWLLVDAQVDLAALEKANFSLVRSTQAQPASPLRISQNTGSGITIETGAATYEISKTNFAFFDRVILGNGTVYEGNTGVVYKGNVVAGPATITVEHQGPQRISLLVKGNIGDGLRYSARMHFYKNLAEVSVDFRVENLNNVEYSGGQPKANDFNSQGSVYFDDISVRFAGDGSDAYVIPQGELGVGGERGGTFQERIALIQESSGDSNWKALQGYGERMQAAVQKRASTQYIDGQQSNGPNQLAGWLDASGVTVAVHHAWQNFPKAFRAEDNTIDIGLFPGEWQKDHVLRPGEFKTHTFWVRYHGANASDIGARAKSFDAPLRLLPSALDISKTQAAGLFAPTMQAAFPDYERGTEFQVITSPSWRKEYRGGGNIYESISMSNNYGYLDYGDIPTDFEVLQDPYSLKYNSAQGLIHQAFRMDNDLWWNLAEPAVQHVADIDIHHSTVEGKHVARGWWQGGPYAHSVHDELGTTRPHRDSGKPHHENLYYSNAILLWAMMTGDTLLLESAIETADNAYWRTVNSSYADEPEAAQCAIDTGLRVCDASRAGGCSGYDSLYPSRDGGNVVKTMNMAYLATGDQEYLDLVEKFSAYVNCREQAVGYDGQLGMSCNRFHFSGVHVRNLGEYLLLRDRVGLPKDGASLTLLQSRMDYMTGELWDEDANLIEYCYYNPPNIDRTLTPRYDNWLLVLADSFAVGGLVLHQPDLITHYAYETFLHGSKNTSYIGSAQAYFSTKEFVNQVGFGNMFLYAWLNK